MPVDMKEVLVERLRELDAEAKGIRALLASYGEAAKQAAAPRKRGMSAAGRKRLAAAARKRWRDAKKSGRNKL